MPILFEIDLINLAWLGGIKIVEHHHHQRLQKMLHRAHMTSNKILTVAKFYMQTKTRFRPEPVYSNTFRVHKQKMF